MQRQAVLYSTLLKCVSNLPALHKSLMSCLYVYCMIALSIALLVLCDSTWQSTLYMAVKAGVIGRGGAVVIIAIDFLLVLLILGPGVVVLDGLIVSTKIMIDFVLPACNQIEEKLESCWESLSLERMH